MRGKKQQVLILYTELAPYFLACLKALVQKHPVEVHLVRWPVNKEAPFLLEFEVGVTVYERDQLNRSTLLALLDKIDPALVMCSGWVDKDYLAVCKQAKRAGKATVMCSDTAWRGDAKQWAAVFLAKFWISGTFTNAWVSGELQATYARKLGFARSAVQTGFYSADVPAFKDQAERLKEAKKEHLPHRFLCVARYISTKGHQYLCEAFAELVDEGRAQDWELWCVGTGELHPLSFQHDRIKHIGFVQPADLLGIQKECSVFVLPSIYEPWGVVVQEHALAGFPMILSDAVGASERFLKDGVNGYIFQANRKTALQERMLALIETDDDSIRKMGDASIALGRDWDPNKWAELLMKQMKP